MGEQDAPVIAPDRPGTFDVGLSTVTSTIVNGLLSQINDVGTVAPGRRADLIACRGNPLTDLSALHDVAHVMADGNEVA